jgi:hypothetical protein
VLEVKTGDAQPLLAAGVGDRTRAKARERSPQPYKTVTEFWH